MKSQRELRLANRKCLVLLKYFVWDLLQRKDEIREEKLERENRKVPAASLHSK